MAEDLPKSKDKGAEGAGVASELAELRDAAQALIRKLRSYGTSRAGEIGEELEEGSETLVREGRRLAHDMRERLGQVEARVERHAREHPATWIGGVLGAIGFGLILGMILRRRD